jgi:hypothetical protein
MCSRPVEVAVASGKIAACESLSVTTTATSPQASRPWPMRLRASPTSWWSRPTATARAPPTRCRWTVRCRYRRPPTVSISSTAPPTDCVHIALTGMLDYRPDLVVSGINNGQNMGDDTLYSGTVAAATEAYLFGIPAIAFSQVHGGWERSIGGEGRARHRAAPLRPARIAVPAEREHPEPALREHGAADRRPGWGAATRPSR